jgi:ankyrin repeat protein
MDAIDEDEIDEDEIDEDDDYWTPLITASVRGFVQLVKELVENGADTEVGDNDDMTPLHFACGLGNLAVVNELLSPSDSNGAATSILGKRKSQGGANINAKDIFGDTPLHEASAGGHVVIVKALLSGGAYILAADNQGVLPIHVATSQGHSEVSKCLLQHFYATFIPRLPLHELLEDVTSGDDGRDPNIRVALEYQVLDTDDVVEILEYLVDRDPTLLRSRDKNRLLPLHLACRRGASFAIVQSLVNHYKASVKSVTPQGDLPLFLACEMPATSLDTIFLLMKLYPDLVYR